MFPYAFSGEFRIFRVTPQMIVHLDYLIYEQKCKYKSKFKSFLYSLSVCCLYFFFFLLSFYFRKIVNLVFKMHTFVKLIL